MKFRILEKILDAFKDDGLYYIYVNPTPQELRSKEDSKSNRGVIDINGDLYMEAAWDDSADGRFSDWIHDDLIEQLHTKRKCLKLIPDEWWRDYDSINYGVCVHRSGSSLNFYIAESYDGDVVREGMDKIKKIFAKAKKKNPLLNFHTKFIYEAEY